MASETIAVKRELLKSKAFRTLGGTAKTVYFDLLMKCKLSKLKTPEGRKKEWIITNNGEIEYCYSEAEKKGIARPKFVKAIDQLIENGLIDIVHLGMGGHKGDKSKYSISERWRAWGTENFINKKRPKDTRKGRGWDAYHQKKSLNIGIENDTPSSIKNDTPRYKNNIIGVSKTLLEKISQKEANI